MTDSPMKKIGAWIRDPRNNWLKGMSKRADLYEIFCAAPETCDLLKTETSCLLCGISPCKFGRKSGTQGPTPRARSFHSTLAKWRKANDGFLDRLKPLRAYNRVFKANGHFYLPYNHMTSSFGDSTAPLKSKWVSEGEMTTELLARICTARPRALFGGEIGSYQKTEVPKFIADLHAHYPDVFALLSADQKRRLAEVNYVGRTADITTCAPGTYTFGTKSWRWDGEFLHSNSMLFPPTKGEIEIKVRPNDGEPAKITDNSQVTPETRFLD